MYYLKDLQEHAMQIWHFVALHRSIETLVIGLIRDAANVAARSPRKQKFGRQGGARPRR